MTQSLKDMSIRQMEAHLQQILLDDHPLTAEQRFSLKSAIEIMELMYKMAPGMHEAVKQMQSKGR
jgi:hypothetical protein